MMNDQILSLLGIIFDIEKAALKALHMWKGARKLFEVLKLYCENVISRIRTLNTIL